MNPILTCPYCQHRFPLTRGRYFKAGMGRHDCPACGRRSKLQRRLRYLGLAILNGLVVVFLPLAWWSDFTNPAELGQIIVPGALLFIVAMEIDRHIEGRVRRLVPLGGSPRNPQRVFDDRPLKPLGYENPYASILHDDED